MLDNMKTEESLRHMLRVNTDYFYYTSYMSASNLLSWYDWGMTETRKLNNNNDFENQIELCRGKRARDLLQASANIFNYSLPASATVQMFLTTIPS